MTLSPGTPAIELSWVEFPHQCSRVSSVQWPVNSACDVGTYTIVGVHVYPERVAIKHSIGNAYLTESKKRLCKLR